MEGLHAVRVGGPGADEAARQYTAIRTDPGVLGPSLRCPSRAIVNGSDHGRVEETPKHDAMRRRPERAGVLLPDAGSVGTPPGV